LLLERERARGPINIHGIELAVIDKMPSILPQSFLMGPLTKEHL